MFPYAVPFEISIATHELEEWDEENRVCYVSWQSFKLGEEDALKYSGLAQKLDQMRMDAAVYAQEDMEYLLELEVEGSVPVCLWPWASPLSSVSLQNGRTPPVPWPH